VSVSKQLTATPSAVRTPASRCTATPEWFTPTERPHLKTTPSWSQPTVRLESTRDLTAEGVELDNRGFIKVADQLGTSNDRGFAAGDVTGGPQFVDFFGVSAGGGEMPRNFAAMRTRRAWRASPRSTSGPCSHATRRGRGERRCRRRRARGGVPGCGDGLACELEGDSAPYEPGLGRVMVMRAVK